MSTRYRGKNAFAGGANPQGNGATTSSFEAALNASWEIDLWGRVRRLNEAARAQFFASEEARRGVRLSLIAEVAQDYFQLLELDAELEIARRTTNSYGESLSGLQPAPGRRCRLQTRNRPRRRRSGRCRRHRSRSGTAHPPSGKPAQGSARPGFRLHPARRAPHRPNRPSLRSRRPARRIAGAAARHPPGRSNCSVPPTRKWA